MCNGDVFGEALSRLAQDAKALARDLIGDYQIDCDLKPGVAHPDHKPSNAQDTRAYVEHLLRKFQYEQIE